MYYASIWWPFGDKSNGILRQESKTRDEMTTESDELWIWTTLIWRLKHVYDDDNFFFVGLGGWVGRWGWRLSVIILCNYKTHLLNSNWKQVYGHMRKKCNNNRCRRKKERNDRNTVATYRTSARWRNSFQLHVSLEEWNPKRQRFLKILNSKTCYGKWN